MRADRCFNPFLDPASRGLVATIRLDESGLRLGGATRLVRFAEGTDRLAVSQDADRFVALLSVAFRQEPLVPGGLNVVPLTAPDPLDPKGMNQPLGPQEQQRIADTVDMIIAGNPADLATLEPHAYQNIADQ